MKDIPLKWKLFLVFSYILFIFFTAFLISIFYRLFSSDKHLRVADYPVFILISALGLISLNYFLNIYAAHRYFPDTPLPKRNKKLMNIVGVITAILWILLLVLCIIVLKDVLTPGSDFYTNRARITMGVSCFLWLLGLYTLVMQLEFSLFLTHTHSKKMNSLIESIGNQ